MSNKSRRLYLGSRVIEHKEKLYRDSFTTRYCFDILVWYEEHADFVSARAREVQIKAWGRDKKLELILSENPDWADLSLEWQDDPGWQLEPEARPRLKRRLQHP